MSNKETGGFRLTNSSDATVLQIVDNGTMTTSSTTAAWRPPVLTTTQRDALTAVNGDMIFNSTTGKHEGYNGSWNAFY